jgi:hypothetical protein
MTRLPFALGCVLVSSAALGSCATSPAPTITVRPVIPGWLVAAVEYGTSPQLTLGHGQRFVATEDRWTALASSMDSAIVAAAQIGSRWLFASESHGVALLG